MQRKRGNTIIDVVEIGTGKIHHVRVHTRSIEQMLDRVAIALGFDGYYFEVISATQIKEYQSYHGMIMTPGNKARKEVIAKIRLENCNEG